MTAASDAARALVARRWKKTTKAQRKAHASTMAAARWDQATDQDRAAVGAKLAEARRLAREKRAENAVDDS